MKKIHLAQMNWCESAEPICAGANKKKVSSAALHLLRDEYGSGHVDRGAAMCAVPITSNDITVIEIPLID